MPLYMKMSQNINKTARHLKFRYISILIMNNAPQSCQDESGLLKVLNTEDKKNGKVNSTTDLYNREKDGNVFKGNNILHR